MHTEFVVGEFLGKRAIGRSKRRWEDNIKMDVMETGCENRRWNELVQDRVL